MADLDLRATNVLLIARSRRIVARSRRTISLSSRLIRQSARAACPHLEGPLRPGQRELSRLVDDLVRSQADAERRDTAALLRFAHWLRSAAEEIRVISQETRWRAHDTSLRAAAARQRSQRLRDGTGKPARRLTARAMILA